MRLDNLAEKFRDVSMTLNNISFTDVKLTENFKNRYKEYIEDVHPSGYGGVEWATHTAKITTTTNKIIFVPNFWFCIAAELASYLRALVRHRDVFLAIYKDSDVHAAAVSLRDNLLPADRQKISDYFSAKKFSEIELQHFFAFVSDYKSWGGGKTIDRADFYVSPLLQAGSLLAETQGAVAEIAKQFLDQPILSESFSQVYKPSPSFNNQVLLSSRIQGDFVYKLIEYLIANTIQKPLFDCFKERESGSINIELGEHRLTSILWVTDVPLAPSDLVSGTKLRWFEHPYMIGDRFYYLSTEWTFNKGSRLDITVLRSIIRELYKGYDVVKADGVYSFVCDETFGGQTRWAISKPFVLLAGISGTGKTRFVREQAKASGNLSETYCLTSVRPDWHEPSDLLGYVSRLNGAPQYVTTDVLKFVAKAWRKIADSGLNIEVRELEGHGHRLVVTGTRDDLEKIPPYWLCLDEMNLAPVEQYFADYLSVLETREWEWIGDQFIYSSDALLGSETIKESNASGIRRSLGFDNDEYNELWHKIFHFGLAIPFNLIVAGTVNMDETTHGFSRKVIDRALSFDFGEFFPNNFDEFPGFGSQKSRNKLLSYPTWSTVNSSDLADTHDPDGTKTIMFLSAVNAVLKHTPFELAFRAMNELLLSVAAHQPQDDYSLKAVWDDFVMCKLLPRIEGDSDKLTLPNGKSLLTELEIVLADQLDPIWPIEEGVTASLRPDLHREKLLESEGSDEDLVLRIPCRSKIKVLWMKDRLANATFTSFWP
jgi:hypothetical protein